MQSYYKESGLKSTLDDKMSFEEAKRFCCKKVHKRAIRRCLEVNVDFRRFYKKSKSGLSLGKNFIYFSKAISFSYLIIMLRDFKLLCNGVTHGEISRLFKKYAVQINEEREKVTIFHKSHISIMPKNAKKNTINLKYDLWKKYKNSIIFKDNYLNMGYYKFIIICTAKNQNIF